MDNLTHGLLGAAIGLLRRRDGGPDSESPVAPPSHTDKAVVLAAFLAGELPDLDVFFGSGPVDEYVYHRGLTHAVLFAPVVAAIATGAAKLLWRQARVKTVYAWSLASVLIAHLLNDFMTGWGTRLLLPFSEARLGLDWVPIIDLLYTLPLLACVILAWRRPQQRRKLMAGVLTYLAVYTFGYRGTTHMLTRMNVAEAYAGQPVRQVRVAPNLFNPLAWQYTVDLGDRFEQGTAYPFGTPGRPEVIAKPTEDEVIRAVRQAPELKPFFDQFAYVLIQYRKVASGYEVTLGDVRYRFRDSGMQMVVVLSPDLKVQDIR